MSAFDHLPTHAERELATKVCHHRFRWHHGPRKARNLLWLRWWKAKLRRHMNKLLRDARKTGWRKHGRGWRYQILGGAYTGKLCHSRLEVRGNQVTGGSPRERLRAAAERAMARDAAGMRHSFYSQSGAWTVRFGITGEPHGCRSDCSQWVTSIYHSAGLPDPNGQGYTGGYTGTLGAHGRAISESQLRDGDLILYGPWPHHHVEMKCGPGSTTAGHGSTHVDRGTVHLLGGEIHCRSYLP